MICLRAWPQLIKRRYSPLKFCLADGTFFDGWEAILVEDGAGERFIYRHEETAVVEAVWPKGMFRRVIDQAITEFEGLAEQSISKGTNAVCK